MKATLQQAWRTRGLLARILWPVSIVYALLMTIRRWLFRSGVLSAVQLGVPVIVVGNITVGGGGKTPLVMALVAHFAGRGLQPGVVSRGYGRRSTGCIEVLPNMPTLVSGDEPALIKRARAAPVFIANDRVEAAQALLAAYPKTDILISDDGLQHDRLRRSVNIVVSDDSGLGNGWLLPAGPLRQRWPLSAHSAPTLVLHTGGAPAFGGFTSQRELADAAVAADGQVVPLASMATVPGVSGKLMALAGIAHPEAFFAMLTARGLPLVRTLAMADHADFSKFDLANLQMADEPFITVLCTEKDAIKLFELPQIPTVRLLAVPLLFTPELSFFIALDQALQLAPDLRASKAG